MWHRGGKTPRPGIVESGRNQMQFCDLDVVRWKNSLEMGDEICTCLNDVFSHGILVAHVATLVWLSRCLDSRLCGYHGFELSAGRNTHVLHSPVKYMNLRSYVNPQNMILVESWLSIAKGNQWQSATQQDTKTNHIDPSETTVSLPTLKLTWPLKTGLPSKKE